MLTAGSAILSASLFELAAPDAVHAADLTQRIQRGAYLSKVQLALKETVAENTALIPELLRLALNDAATYDKATKTGGANGSIRFSEELGRPENKGLDKAVQLLEKVKGLLDASEDKSGPIGWADLIQLAGRAAAKASFLEAAVRKAGGDRKKGRTIVDAFGSSSQWGFFDKQFGRKDATEADPPGRVLDWAKASNAEIKEKFAAYGLKPRQVVALSPFFGPDQDAVERKLAEDPEFAPFVQKYQRSRETISQTNYEVDLITTFTKLAQLGAPISYETYTYPPPRVTFKF